jgi:hypothetical protein
MKILFRKTSQILLFVFSAYACSAQEKKNEINTLPKINNNQPNVSIHVKKQKDKNGNIIRYDSTYSWSYSGSDKNAMDSVFGNFNDRFDLVMPDLFNDSGRCSCQNSFFKGLPGDMIKGWSGRNNYMEQMMQKMDSLQQMFFTKPELYQGKKQNEQLPNTL